MFKLRFKFLLILLLLLTVPSLCFAALDVQEDGVTVGGNFASRLNFTGDVEISGNFSEKTINIGAGAGAISVQAVTSDTLTAAESGKTFVYHGFGIESDTAVTLPAAANGLVYHFTDGGMGGENIIIDTAAATDRIVFLALDAGDKIASPGTTGDSLSIIGHTDGRTDTDVGGFWYITEMGSTIWTDGGA